MQKGKDREYRWKWLILPLFSVIYCPAYKGFVFSHHCCTIYRIYLWSKGTSLPRWCHFGLCLVLADRMWAEMMGAVSELKPKKPLSHWGMFSFPSGIRISDVRLLPQSGSWNLESSQIKANCEQEMKLSCCKMLRFWDFYLLRRSSKFTVASVRQRAWLTQESLPVPTDSPSAASLYENASSPLTDLLGFQRGQIINYPTSWCFIKIYLLLFYLF